MADPAPVAQRSSAARTARDFPRARGVPQDNRSFQGPIGCLHRRRPAARPAGLGTAGPSDGNVLMEGKPPGKPADLAGYLEALSRAVFQAGISWRVTEAKWDGIRDGFVGFAPEVVAGYGPDDVERLLADPRVIRSKAKIEATIDNAQAVLELHAEYRGFDRYLRSHGGFEQTVADLKRQFRFIGDTGACHFLWSVGEPAPPYDEWRSAVRQRARASGPPRPLPEKAS